jgi:uncharacterized iron-regulated protein
MPKVLFSLLTGSLLMLLAASPLYSDDRLQVYRLSDGAVISEATFTEALAAQRFILVGERHTVVRHHQGQLAVIRRLADKGLPVAIGMEMMRSDSQPHLDAWIAGELSEAQFRAVYADNWNYPWAYYRPIFVYAREQGIPIIGLNVSREITRQVAREGFDSLSTDQRGDLPFVSCRVDEAYLAYIKEAYGAHAHGSMKFEHFCEAQLVWDKAMALNAVQSITGDPQRRLVILAGTGHARKGGIPRQLEALGHHAYAVVLPEIPSVLDPETLGAADADFLLRDR